MNTMNINTDVFYTHMQLSNNDYKAQFTINEEQRTVKCLLEVAEICDGILFPGEFYSGKAKCSQEDTWDVSFGKQLAFSRAVDKLMNKRYKMCLRAAQKFADSERYFFDRIIYKHFKKNAPEFLADLIDRDIPLNSRFFAAPRNI